MPATSSHTRNFTESVIRRMTRIAIEHGAINLSQGFPDFDPPRKLTAALAKLAPSGPHQYAITWGAENFRQALARKQSLRMGIPVDGDRHITVTCGSTEAMIAAMMSTVNPGDKVIVFSPFYENYGADAVLSGAEPLYVPLVPPDFCFDRAVLQKAFAQRPRALILCNPSNPSGKVFTREELEYIAGLAEQYDAWVITDEVYEHIVYKPAEHVYFASLPGMGKRTISCSSLSKTYSITGWRLGYTIAAEEVTGIIRKVHDFLTVGAAAPLMEAAVTALNFPQTYYDELLASYTNKRDLFLRCLDRAGLRYIKPQGAYYVLVDISEFSKTGDTRFCEWLAKEVKVAAVPGSSFFKPLEDGSQINHLIRFHFAKKEETLRSAGERLEKLRTLWAAGGYGEAAP
ncbi:MAG: aminotransferase class I/II-fold pyridoxal phosphate-dependent enzyme [Spirochaetaceae bacterium]|jgi:aminotransferase|nr:aminotransferase class I/II-fold pyridoxal phosphate-dependent enzyme [Spirochaetaceae bacterium]